MVQCNKCFFSANNISYRINLLDWLKSAVAEMQILTEMQIVLTNCNVCSLLLHLFGMMMNWCAVSCRRCAATGESGWDSWQRIEWCLTSTGFKCQTSTLDASLVLLTGKNAWTILTSENWTYCSWINGSVVSALGIRARGPRFDSRVVLLFHWVATLGKLFTHIVSPVSQLQETGVQKGVFGA